MVVTINKPGQSKWRLQKCEKGDKVWFEILNFTALRWMIEHQIEDEALAVQTFEYIIAPMKTTIIKEA